MTGLASPALLLGMVAAVAVGLAAVAHSGWRGRRRLHLAELSVVLPAVVATLVVAERVGRGFRFDPTRLAVHLSFAYAAVATLLVVIATGLARLRTARAAVAHRLAVIGFLLAVVGAAGTGPWMMANAEPRGGPGPSGRPAVRILDAAAPAPVPGR